MTFASRTITLPIHVYRMFISPLLGNNCRFEPSCSAYALEAIDKHGALWGAVLASKRICKCHPWGGSGYDPVPEVKKSLQSRNNRA